MCLEALESNNEKIVPKKLSRGGGANKFAIKAVGAINMEPAQLVAIPLDRLIGTVEDLYSHTGAGLQVGCKPWEVHTVVAKRCGPGVMT